MPSMARRGFWRRSRCIRDGPCGRCGRGYARFGVVSCNHGIGDVRRLSGEEHGRLLRRVVQHKRIALFLGVALHHPVDLLRKGAVGLADVLLKIVASILSTAVELLGLVVDGLGPGGTLGVGQFGTVGLELLGEGVHLGLQLINLLLPGLVFLLQVRKALLAFVGLGYSRLKGNDRDLRGRSGGGGGSRLLCPCQGRQTHGQHGYNCEQTLHVIAKLLRYSWTCRIGRFPCGFPSARVTAAGEDFSPTAFPVECALAEAIETRLCLLRNSAILCRGNSAPEGETAGKTWNGDFNRNLDGLYGRGNGASM